MFNGMLCMSIEAKSCILYQFFCIPTKKIPVLFPPDQKSFPKRFLSSLQTLVSPRKPYIMNKVFHLLADGNQDFSNYLIIDNKLVDYYKWRGYHNKLCINLIHYTAKAK